MKQAIRVTHRPYCGESEALIIHWHPLLLLLHYFPFSCSVARADFVSIPDARRHHHSSERFMHFLVWRRKKNKDVRTVATLQHTLMWVRENNKACCCSKASLKPLDMVRILQIFSDLVEQYVTVKATSNIMLLAISCISALLHTTCTGGCKTPL